MGRLPSLLTGDKALKNQQKKGRPRSENPMAHTAVLLPQDLFGRLRKDAERSGRGLSAEIRQRLQFTDGLDPETLDLIEDIKSLADFSPATFWCHGTRPSLRWTPSKQASRSSWDNTRSWVMPPILRLPVIPTMPRPTLLDKRTRGSSWPAAAMIAGHERRDAVSSGTTGME